MSSSTVLCIAVAVFLTGAQAFAQTAPSAAPAPTPPSEPLLNTAPDFSAWAIVRYRIPGLAKQSAEAVMLTATPVAQLESVTSVTKTGGVRHVSRKLKAGDQEDIWYEHGNRITMESMWAIPMFEASVNGAGQQQGADFPELSWISAANFVGPQEHDNVAYFVFESKITEGNPVAAKDYGYQLNVVFKRAYIAADTRLPWLVQTGDVLQRYVFQAAPTAMIEVPPAYQTMFDTYEKKKAEPVRKPVAP